MKRKAVTEGEAEAEAQAEIRRERVQLPAEAFERNFWINSFDLLFSYLRTYMGEKKKRDPPGVFSWCRGDSFPLQRRALQLFLCLKKTCPTMPRDVRKIIWYWISTTQATSDDVSELLESCSGMKLPERWPIFRALAKGACEASLEYGKECSMAAVFKKAVDLAVPNIEQRRQLRFCAWNCHTTGNKRVVIPAQLVGLSFFTPDREFLSSRLFAYLLAEYVTFECPVGQVVDAISAISTGPDPYYMASDCFEFLGNLGGPPLDSIHKWLPSLRVLRTLNGGSVQPYHCMYIFIEDSTGKALAHLLLLLQSHSQDEKDIILRFFCSLDATRAVEVCIQAGADVNSLGGDEGNAAIAMWAQGSGGSPFRTLDVLLNAGALINTVNQDGRTPLMLCAGGAKEISVPKALVKNGAEIDLCDNQGKTAIFFAAYWGNLKTVLYFQGLGADLTAIGGSLLYPYVTSNSLFRAAEELESGGDPDLIVFGEPLIVAAARTRSNSTLEALLRYGANVRAVNSDGETALDVAEGVGDNFENEELANFLRPYYD